MALDEKTIERLQRLVAVAIAELRRARGLSVSDLATAAGISEPSMEAIESGFDPPTIVTFARIAAALDSDSSDLLATAEGKFNAEKNALNLSD